MHDDEDLQVVGTTSDYLIQQLTDEEEGKDFAVEYFKSGFLSSAVNTLFYMRRQAGLTQAQVAERLNTKQSAVARLEGDFDGGISLRRYIDFALACGMVPHSITFAPLESAINYTIAQPKIAYTQVNHQEWLKANPAPIESVVQVERNSEAMSKTLQLQSDTVFAIEKDSTSALTDSSTVASSATTLHQEYFQPYLIPPLQPVPSMGRTSTALESQNKIANLAPSKVS
jgi:transcriptional regulator with XRE-family HTH domain